MNEILIGAGKKSDLGRLTIDIDFKGAEVGATGIVDKSGRVWTSNNTPGAVAEDPVHGKVFKFAGAGYFTTPMVDDILLAGKSFRLTTEFKPNSKTAVQTLHGTGTYPNPGGYSLSVNQYPTTYIQIFLEQSGTKYDRILPQLSNNDVWEKAVFTYRKGKQSLEIFRDGNSVAFQEKPAFAFGSGSPLFYIGGAPGNLSGAALFNGWMKSLTLEIF